MRWKPPPGPGVRLGGTTPLWCLGLAQLAWLADDFLKPLQGHHELGAAFREGQVVHFVDDDEADGVQVATQGVAVQQELQGLGRRDQEVGRGLGLSRPFAGRGVAMAHADGQAEGLSPGDKAAEQVAVEGAQRCHVEDLEAGRPRLALGVQGVAFGQQPTEDRQEGGLGLAVARGGDEQDVLAGLQGSQSGVLGLREAGPALAG